jgi:hypothetical protein
MGKAVKAEPNAALKSVEVRKPIEKTKAPLLANKIAEIKKKPKDGSESS